MPLKRDILRISHVEVSHYNAIFSNIVQIKGSVLIIVIKFWPYKKSLLFPVPAQITFGKRIKKKFISYFIEFDVFGTATNFFSVKTDPFCPLFS